MSFWQRRIRKRRNRKSVVFLLQRATPESIQQAKEATANLINYHWNYYSELAQQRKIYRDELLFALRNAAKNNFVIDGWQRSIKFKYSNHPLSTIGSISFNGGRFNSGNRIHPEITPLHALYLAVDKDTALQEQLGQGAINSECALSPQEIALTSKDSVSTLCISGKIDSFIDLHDKQSLSEFLDVIKKFTVSKELHKESLRVNEQAPNVIKTMDALLFSLLDPNWRSLPSCYDIPANSQIFGQLVCDAGIQAILYPSKLSKKPCLVIFPQNIANTDNYIKLDGDIPANVIITHLNSQNWKLSRLSYEDIIEIRKVDQPLH